MLFMQSTMKVYEYIVISNSLLITFMRIIQNCSSLCIKKHQASCIDLEEDVTGKGNTWTRQWPPECCGIIMKI